MKKYKLPQELVKFNQTFDKAVSRILSPVVVIVTGENATNRNYVHNLWLVTKWLSFTITNIISFYISNRLAVKHIQKKIEADSIYSIIEHLVLDNENDFSSQIYRPWARSWYLDLEVSYLIFTSTDKNQVTFLVLNTLIQMWTLTLSCSKIFCSSITV